MHLSTVHIYSNSFVFLAIQKYSIYILKLFLAIDISYATIFSEVLKDGLFRLIAFYNFSQNNKKLY